MFLVYKSDETCKLRTIKILSESKYNATFDIF